MTLELSQIIALDICELVGGQICPWPPKGIPTIEVRLMVAVKLMR